MTDNKNTNSTDVISSAASKEKITSDTSSNQKKAIPAKKASNTTQKVMSEPSSQSKSVLSIFALIIAIIAILSCAGIFYWQNQQQVTLESNLLKQSSQQASDTILKIKTLLKNQQTDLGVQLSKNATKVQQASEKELLELKAQIEHLSQNQPSDWLLHEAEYLIRIAARTIWLEKDTKAAINLLQDANLRIQELNDPHYLPLRQVIHDDIETLKLLPSLNTQEVVLTLMSLNKHISKLPLAMAKIPQTTETVDSLELSDDANDWKANLAKSWAKFIKDFITINRRSGNVEPLISPQYQQNLQENLSLKLQLAQWATTQENSNIYLASLNDIHKWTEEYFDLNAPQTNLFIQEILTLKKALITYEYPSSLNALNAIHELLKKKNTLIEKSKTPESLENPKEIELKPQLEKPKKSEDLKAPQTLPALASEMMEGA